jgi:hypothetical protein
VRAKSAADGRFAATNPLRDVLRGQPLVYVQSREFRRFDRRLHQVTITLLLVLVNVWSCGHSALLQPPSLV